MIAPATSRWILTASGRRFDLDAPRPEDVDPLDLAHALSHLCRFAGHVRRFYSVAQHCVLVSELVEPPFALPGLLHDAGEAYVGDVVGPLARGLDEFRAVESRVLDAVATRFGLDRYLLDAPEVRHADAVALLTERAALLPPSPEPWAQDLAGFTPAALALRPWSPRRARREYLARLRSLGALP